MGVRGCVVVRCGALCRSSLPGEGQREDSGEGSVEGGWRGEKPTRTRLGCVAVG